VSLIDGIVMGGGVGVSLHGAYRVAGDRYRFAMPEVAIGFFPDVGATYALPRLPGEAGMYLALTGARGRPDDAGELGLADPCRALERDARIVERLVAGRGWRPCSPPPPARRSRGRSCGNGRRSMPASRPRASRPSWRAWTRRPRPGSDFARATAADMRTKAPSSMAIAFEQVRRGRDLSFEEAMATEFRIVSRVIREPDFIEGVRATIIDKDGAPRWAHAGIDKVEPGWVASHFASLGSDELGVA
jgi:enoyl-CoA hydratase